MNNFNVLYFMNILINGEVYFHLTSTKIQLKNLKITMKPVEFESA